MPNSERCISEYLCAILHVANDSSDRQFGLAARTGRARAPTLNGGDGDLPHEKPYAYRLVLGCSVGCGWLAMSFATGIIKIVGSLPISDLIPGAVAPRSLANLLSG
jgi:hypothetical protein